jgi:hypothetical protein
LFENTIGALVPSTFGRSEIPSKVYSFSRQLIGDFFEDARLTETDDT